MQMLALAASLAVALPGLGPSAAEPAKKCGDTVTSGAGAFDVRANGVTCRKARRVARTYDDEQEVAGWRCRDRQLDLEHFSARCTRRGAVVRFGYGS